MAGRHHKPGEIVAKLRQVEVLVGQGRPVAEAIRTIGVTEPTYYRWRAGHGGLKLDQVRRLKLLERENGRLRRAVSDLDVGGADPKAPAEPWPKAAQVGWRRREAGRRRTSSRCRGPCHGGAGRLAASCLQGAGPAPLHAAQGRAQTRRRGGADAGDRRAGDGDQTVPDEPPTPMKRCRSAAGTTVQSCRLPNQRQRRRATKSWTALRHGRGTAAATTAHRHGARE